MEITLTRKSFSDSDGWYRAVEEFVADTVLYFRNRGHRNEIAIEQAALALGLTKPKTWSLLYQRPVVVTREEHDRVFLAVMRQLDERAEDFAKRRDAAIAKRRQMELGLS